MNIIASIIPWIQANWTTIAQVYLQIIGLASIIVKLTPTLKDDDVLKTIIRFMGKYVALNKGSGPNA